MESLFVIDGTMDNDGIEGSVLSEKINAYDGNDIIYAYAGSDTINAGSGNDYIESASTQSSLTNSLYQFEDGWGQDTIHDVAGTDTLDFSTVTSSLTVDLSSQGTDGTNTVVWTSGDILENVIGTSQNDNLSGNAANNVLTGNAGNDTIDGKEGTDTLVGGTGNDTYGVDNIGDVITENANEGTDTVESTVSYTLANNVENITLLGNTNIQGTGNSLNNTITGNSGRNTLDGQAGDDTLSGDLGNDTYIVDSVNDVVVENANSGFDMLQASISYTLGNNFEQLALTGSGNIDGTGNTVDNSLLGNSGNNTLTGLDGNDTLDGGQGSDSLIGGLGDDTYIVDNAGDVITENSDEGVDTVQSSVTYTLGSNLENLVLTGTSGINATGNALDNILVGNAGNNTLTASDGDDILDGSTGDDSLLGGIGDDWYAVDSTNDVVTENSNEGTDTVYSTVNYTLGANVENLVLIGTDNLNGTGNSLDNTIAGNDGNNSISGDAGNDTLDGAAGIDTLVGGMDNDTYIVDNVSDVVTENASEGTDIIETSVSYTLVSNVENLTLTGSSNINGTGNSLNNILTGNSGNNSLAGAAGNDTLDGGSGNDTYVFTNGWGQDFITDTAGVDTIDLTDVSSTLTTSHLYFGYAEDEVSDGTNTINWEGSTIENIITGSTNDSIFGNDSDNTINTGSGSDSLNGYTGNDTLLAGDGDDSLTGGDGNDSLDGGAGNDYFYLSDTWGQDTLTDSSGSFDRVIMDTVTSNLTINLNSTGSAEVSDGTNTLNWSGSVIEDLYAGQGNDNITGNDNANAIWGYLGNDSITGGLGNDTLDGDAGADSLIGGSGNDSLVGGAGNDTYVFTNSWGQDFINDTSGIDTVDLSAVSASLTTSHLYFGYAEDEISDGTNTINWEGSTIENIITGSTNDSIFGNDADNVIDTGSGNDSLNGYTGNDTLLAGDGDDSLLGGDGNDSLSGGAESDYYFYLNGWGSDTITDSAGTSDELFFDTVTSDLTIHLDTITGAEVTDGTNTIELGTSEIEHLTAGLGNDTIYGNSLGNAIWSLDGNDTITAGDGSDTIYAGAGNDSIDGGDSYDYYFFLSNWGQDTISDSSGSWDRVSLDSITSNLTINLNSTGSNEVSDGTNTINWSSSVIEDAYAGQGNDSITGNNNANAIWGNSGNDTIQGGLGNDNLEGGSGNDVYTFAEGDGVDTILDSGNTDKVLFDSSVTQSEVAIWIDGSGNLQIGNTSSSGDLITVNNQTTASNTIERLELNSGYYLTDSDVNQIIQDMTAYATNNSISLTSLNDVKNDANLLAIVNAGWHS